MLPVYLLQLLQLQQHSIIQYIRCIFHPEHYRCSSTQSSCVYAAYAAAGAAVLRQGTTPTAATGQAGALNPEIPRLPFMGPPAAAYSTPAGARSGAFAAPPERGAAAAAVSQAALPPGYMYHGASLAAGFRGVHHLDGLPYVVSVQPGWWQGAGYVAKEATAALDTPASKLAGPAGLQAAAGADSPATPMHAAVLPGAKVGMDGANEGRGGEGDTGAHEEEQGNQAKLEVGPGAVTGEEGSVHVAWQAGGVGSRASVLPHGDVQRSGSPGLKDSNVQGHEMIMRRGGRARR
eukprot:scaffold264236_cov23-Tisochrysis_lutea.AAC.1